MALTSKNLAKILNALIIQYGKEQANKIFIDAIEDVIKNYLKFQMIHPVDK